MNDMTPLPVRPSPRLARNARGVLALAAMAVAIAAIAAEPAVMPFSAAAPGASTPPKWSMLRLSSRKAPTAYRLALDHGVVVLHASANASVAGMVQPTSVDVAATPVVQWRWKVSSAIEGANNRVGAKEDAPARLVFAFDGDRTKLSLADHALSFVTRRVAQRELPYATLMYIFSDCAPVGTIIPNPYTRRVQMIVVAGSRDGVGEWQPLVRNLRDDYRRAFGEEPGMLTDIGVMTDTDNTGGSVEAWYGDIHLMPPRTMTAAR
jgi:hypothetical protein